MIATLDENFFAREIKLAFEKRADADQAKKQNYIEMDKGMLEMITTSHYLAKGKFAHCVTVACRFEGKSHPTLGQACPAKEGPQEARGVDFSSAADSSSSQTDRSDTIDDRHHEIGNAVNAVASKRHERIPVSSATLAMSLHLEMAFGPPLIVRISRTTSDDISFYLSICPVLHTSVASSRICQLSAPPLSPNLRRHR